GIQPPCRVPPEELRSARAAVSGLSSFAAIRPCSCPPSVPRAVAHVAPRPAPWHVRADVVARARELRPACVRVRASRLPGGQPERALLMTLACGRASRNGSYAPDGPAPPASHFQGR